MIFRGIRPILDPFDEINLSVRLSKGSARTQGVMEASVPVPAAFSDEVAGAEVGPDVPEFIEAPTAAPIAAAPPSPPVQLDWKRLELEIASRLILASVRTVKSGERRLRRSQSRQYRSEPALTI